MSAADVRAGAYFSLHRLIGSNLREIYGDFLSTKTMERDALDEMQGWRLESLLSHAAAHVPFYRERLAGDQTRLASFPILTKEDIRLSFDRLMTEELRKEYAGLARKARYSWIPVSTGGSTGVPTTVIHDRRGREFGRAGKLFSNAMSGFPLGTPYLMLWGSMRDINDMKTSWTGRTAHYLLATEILNAFRMDADTMESYINRINASASTHMMAYVDAVDHLARFAEKHGKTVKPLASVMACAGTVHPHMRETISRVFGCRVHNKYGSRECGDMACECEAGGMHVFANTVVLEVVDEKGKHVPPETPGRILVTLLHNRDFPIIRYEIGDIGSLRSGTCSCGSPLPLMGGIEGRTYEAIYDTTGHMVSSVYFRHLLGVVHVHPRMRRFQFVQESERCYRLHVELTPGTTEAEGRFTPVLRDLKRVLGEDAVLRLVVSETIPESASGKFLYTKNEYIMPVKTR